MINKNHISRIVTSQHHFQVKANSRNKSTRKKRNSIQGNWLEGRRENTSTLGNKLGNLVGGAPSINQIANAQGKVPPDHSSSDEERKNSHRFRPVVLRHDPQDSWRASIFQLQPLYRSWIRNKDPMNPNTVCLSQIRNNKFFANVESKPGLLIKDFLILDNGAGPTIVQEETHHALLPIQIKDGQLPHILDAKKQPLKFSRTINLAV